MRKLSYFFEDDKPESSGARSKSGGVNKAIFILRFSRITQTRNFYLVCMPKGILFILLAGILFWGAGCNKVSSRKELKKIRELEEQASQNREAALTSREKLDLELLESLAGTYVAFVDSYPEAPETPDFLFRAGELYSNELNNIPLAISLFERIYDEFPRHKTAPNALFFSGYLYHNTLKNLTLAEQAYQKFLELYPEHNMARHAEFELQSLGMSVEEVLEKIINQDSGRVVQDSAMP